MSIIVLHPGFPVLLWSILDPGPGRGPGRGPVRFQDPDLLQRVLFLLIFLMEPMVRDQLAGLLVSVLPGIEIVYFLCFGF